MKTYSRNVRRAWDGDDYRPSKRMRVDEPSNESTHHAVPNKENSTLMVYDIEDNLERAIRETSVAALSSSPSRKNSTIFSLESHEDDGTGTITPPSSPPPQLQLTPPNVKPRKPTFSFLDKQKKEKQKAQQQFLKRKQDLLTPSSRREDSEPLAEIHNSSRAPIHIPSYSFASVNDAIPSPTAAPSQQIAETPTSVAPSTKPLVQSVLDFGQSLQPTTCASCNMTYTPTVPTDTQLHNMFHTRHSSGIELGKSFLKSAMKWCYEVAPIPGSVVVVDRKLSMPARKVVVKVLEVVNKELGSVDIPEEELWSQRAVPGDEDPEARKCDRYKVFLHVIEGKCVGVCLAERIGRAYKVLPENEEGSKMELNGTDNGKDDTPKARETELQQPPTPTSTSHDQPHGNTHDATLTLSKGTFSAVVGVSRIWTSRTFRRKGIANNLLECVMNQFIYGMEIDRTDVAFSQPTEMGTTFAKAWFGNGELKDIDQVESAKRQKEVEGYGWRVYIED